MHLIGHEPGTPIHDDGTVHKETQDALDLIDGAVAELRNAVDEMIHAPFAEVAGGPNPLQGDPIYKAAKRARVNEVDYEGSDRKGLVTPPKRMPRRWS